MARTDGRRVGTVTISVVDPSQWREVWRPIPEWEGRYEASNTGHIRSVDHTHVNLLGQVQRFRGRRMARQLSPGRKYWTVRLGRGRDYTRTYSVHKLVALTFLGPRPAELEVCHDDGDHLNCFAYNLRYDTRASNMADLKRHGRNWNLNLQECQRGHPLEGPNLANYASMRRQRYCSACRWARVTLQYLRKTRGVNPDEGAITALSWMKYEEIAGGVQ